MHAHPRTLLTPSRPGCLQALHHLFAAAARSSFLFPCPAAREKGETYSSLTSSRFLPTANFFSPCPHLPSLSFWLPFLPFPPSYRNRPRQRRARPLFRTPFVHSPFSTATNSTTAGFHWLRSRPLARQPEYPKNNRTRQTHTSPRHRRLAEVSLGSDAGWQRSRIRKGGDRYFSPGYRTPVGNKPDSSPSLALPFSTPRRRTAPHLQLLPFPPTLIDHECVCLLSLSLLSTPARGLTGASILTSGAVRVASRPPRQAWRSPAAYSTVDSRRNLIDRDCFVAFVTSSLFVVVVAIFAVLCPRHSHCPPFLFFLFLRLFLLGRVTAS